MIIVSNLVFSETLCLMCSLFVVVILTLLFVYICIKEYEDGLKKKNEKIKKLEEDYNNLLKDYQDLVDVNNVFTDEEGGE